MAYLNLKWNTAYLNQKLKSNFCLWSQNNMENVQKCALYIDKFNLFWYSVKAFVLFGLHPCPVYVETSVVGIDFSCK